jgi:hypothetical protein
MIAIAISLLFGAAAFASVMVIHASVVRGARRARLIWIELAAHDAPRAGRITPASRSLVAPLFAAA